MSNLSKREQYNRAREQLAREKGVARAVKRREEQAKRGDLSGTKAGMMTSEAARDAVVEALVKYIDDIKTRNPRTKPKWFKHLDYNPVETTAELTLRCCLDAVGANWTRNNLIMQLAKALNSNILNEVLKSSREGEQVLRDIANRVASKPGAPRTRREHALWLAGRRKQKLVKDREGNVVSVFDIDHYHWEEWDRPTSVKVGGKMLQAVFEATDLFENEYIKDDINENEQVKIRLTEKAQTQLTSLNNFLDKQTPQFGPMFNTPYPWGVDSFGPYDNVSIANQVPPVKHMGEAQEKAVMEAMKDGSLDDALEALNTLQEVPYAVNGYVVDAVKWVMENNLGEKVNSFPSLEKTPEIPNIPRAKFSKWSVQDRMDYGREQLNVQKSNREVDANLLGIKRNLDEAENIQQAANEGVVGFYLPHQWDYRGRVYHTSEFGHHNTDYLRAMFEFANKSEITNDNVAFLTLQLANTYGNGVDKETLEFRQQWTIENEDKILACGANFADPDAFEWWSSADDPFQFLAACRVWHEASEHGEGYMTGLPISLDATQSGIQVYGAMCRSQEDGEKVNLTDNKKPGDLYTAVMVEANRLINLDIIDLEYLDHEPVDENDEDEMKERLKLKHARQWLAHGLTRKTVKRNAMTWAYSSRRYGFADQLRTDLMEPLSKKVRKKQLKEHPFGADSGYGASWYMAGVNETAIRLTVTSAADGMDFFQDIVQLCNDAHIHLTYTTPLGFPVHQFYRDLEKAWVVVKDQKCENCGTKYEKNDLVIEDGEEDNEKTWVCQSCKAQNKAVGKIQIVTERIDMPSWDRKAKKTKTLQASLRVYSDDVANSKSKRAVAPNIIHSLDATILMKTVMLMREAGVRDIMTVHDSFSTTIGNVASMSVSVRQAFYWLFDNHCPYTELLEQTLARLEQAPDTQDIQVPDKLDLDLSEVLKSDYAFS